MRLYCVLLFLFASSFLEAQQSDTRYLIGLNGSKGSYKHEVVERSLELKLGVLREHFAMGLVFNYARGGTRIDPAKDILNMGCFARYYFSTGSFRPFGGADVIYGNFFDDFKSETGFEAVRYSPQLGVNYFVNSWLSLECVAKYQMLYGKDIEVYGRFKTTGVVGQAGISLFL